MALKSNYPVNSHWRVVTEDNGARVPEDVDLVVVVALHDPLRAELAGRNPEMNPVQHGQGLQSQVAVVVDEICWQVNPTLVIVIAMGTYG